MHGISHGGIGAFHLLARRLGLIDAIDQRLQLLKIHMPYHESDHVLNFAYNSLCGGTCLQDIELRRNDVHTFFVFGVGGRHSTVGVEEGASKERIGLSFPNADARVVIDILECVDGIFAEASTEIAGGGGIGNALSAESVEEVDIVAA